MDEALWEGWRFCAKGYLSIRCWEQECVLFDSSTGDTHFLGHSEAALLNFFQVAPLVVRKLLALQACFIGDDIEDVLADFELRGFISRE